MHDAENITLIDPVGNEIIILEDGVIPGFFAAGFLSAFYGYALFKESETHLKDYISLYDSLYEQAKHYAMDWRGMTEDEAHCWANL